ncbi:hypothetical protein BU072_12225 [Mammaliicoccus vitulinus]|uniref:DUF1672 domain-containing protein n=1 Tax=Mammaliicoccus vitulinus TaxID=71237 RepID=A0A2T4PQP6_9STAP|nr:DUF1672 domain-containing protein [Mammaliicoccus vitulinus]PTI28135.1 hypothetical protein BU072_12225 [Mammaliicoccus vitulinus]
MKKIASSIIISSLLLSGCSQINQDTNSKSIPEEMPADKYNGQGFQPYAEEDAIEYAKKHRKAFEKEGEQFFKDNFSLNVKATNVVASGDGVEVFVHCDDHDIVFNASIPLEKEVIHHKGSMRSTDDSGAMSDMVGTVLSGFEYRANKEEFDNLTQYFKDNEDKYHYTGFTKEAINKTQNIGYQNEYYYITYLSRSLSEYRKYYEPLINKNDAEFKEGMKKARKDLEYTAKSNAVTTLFSTQKNYSKKKNTPNVFAIAKELEKRDDMPKFTYLSLQFTDNHINPQNPFYDDNDVTDFGVFGYDN